MIRYAPIAAALLALAAPAAAQEEEATPEGVYLVYGEPGGVGFVAVNALQSAANQWPMEFFYFEAGEPAGRATMLGSADCEAGVVTGALTAATAPDGAPLALPPPPERPPFDFERLGGPGDQQIVTFICGDANGRLYLADRPIPEPSAQVADRYIALRAAGLEHRPAMLLAIRSVEDALAIVGEVAPEERREAARAILEGTNNAPRSLLEEAK